MMTPADRLRTARLAAGFGSATDAAKAFGWTVSTYLGHENGSRGLPVDAAQRYGRAFKVAWQFLISGEPVTSEPAESGTPIIGHLGLMTAPLTDRDRADRVMVGVEGYDYTELAAFTQADMRGLYHHIVSIVPDQAILVHDEVLVSTTAPGGRLFSTWVISQQPGVGEVYVASSAHAPDDRTTLSHDEFFALPGLKLEGVVVALYVDKQRRKAIEAAGFVDRATHNALT